MGPAESVLGFHQRLAMGCTDGIGEVFSFAAAHRYWLDVSASLGLRLPEFAAFRRMIEGVFGCGSLQGRLAGEKIGSFRERIAGPVASVVFERDADKGATGVASVVLEEGCWKVLTYPGVFPGELLGQARSRSRSARERERS